MLPSVKRCGQYHTSHMYYFHGIVEKPPARMTPLYSVKYTIPSFTSMQDCECVIKTFRVPNPLSPSIVTSAAQAGRSKSSEWPSQFPLGKLPKYLLLWT